ncbi:MAG: T9SS type A sorting domain-containing protein, partial [Muribaculaceae bacterium]|nr:T9SS type A sorting domain-containing protein [Muribaculaceae bacterium]
LNANTPYIVRTHFGTEAGKVRFAARNITVDRTPNEIRCKGDGYDMLGTFGKRQLNTATSYLLNADGSSFITGNTSSYAADNDDSAAYTVVEPFAVYIEAPENSQPFDIDIPIKDLSGIKDIATPTAGLSITRNGNMLVINSDRACEIKVYDLNGILVKVLHLSAGTNTIDSLPAGIYILNGVKTIL